MDGRDEETDLAYVNWEGLEEWMREAFKGLFLTPMGMGAVHYFKEVSMGDDAVKVLAVTRESIMLFTKECGLQGVVAIGSVVACVCGLEGWVAVHTEDRCLAFQCKDQQQFIRPVFNLFRHLTKKQLPLSNSATVYPAICEGVSECSPPRSKRPVVQVSHLRAIPLVNDVPLEGKDCGSYYQVTEQPPHDGEREKEIVVRNRNAAVPVEVYERLDKQDSKIAQLEEIIKNMQAEMEELRGKVTSAPKHDLQTEPLMPGPTRQVKILVVDDIPINVTVVEKRLAAMGFDCITSCHASQQATTLLNTSCFDLIFLDTDMPYLSGYHLLSYIRANPTHINHSSLFISLILDPSPIDRDKSRAAGFDGCVPKPVETPVLKKLVMSLVKRI